MIGSVRTAIRRLRGAIDVGRQTTDGVRDEIRIADDAIPGGWIALHGGQDAA